MMGPGWLCCAAISGVDGLGRRRRVLIVCIGIVAELRSGSASWIIEDDGDEGKRTEAPEAPMVITELGKTHDVTPSSRQPADA